MKTKTLLVALAALLICSLYSWAGQKDEKPVGTTTENVPACVIESEHAADELSRVAKRCNLSGRFKLHFGLAKATHIHFFLLRHLCFHIFTCPNQQRAGWNNRKK